jgi:dTDP-4-amino-4,6-dideoxygalactose transaminase
MQHFLSSASQLSFSSEESFAAALTVRGPFRFPAMRPLIPEPARWVPYLQKSYEARWFSNFGPAVTDFEKRLTSTFGVGEEVIASANNCTSGIAAALIAFGVRGDVVVPAFSFAGTACAVSMADCRPVVVDVGADDWVLDPAALKEAFATREIKAVVPVVPFGIAYDLGNVLEVCARHGVPVVIDNASGLGSPVAALPERCVEVYSMHATKPFAVGEGAAIRMAAAMLPQMRHALNFGLDRGVPHGNWGINGKMPEVLAAIGLAVLDDYPGILRMRQAVAQNYIELLQPFAALKFPRISGAGPWHGFPVQFPSSHLVEGFVADLAARSVDIRRYYRPSLEDWPGTTKIRTCPNARRHADTTITLPVYSDFSVEEFDVLAAILREVLNGMAGTIREPRGSSNATVPE